MNERLCKIVEKLNQNEECAKVYLKNGTILICNNNNFSPFTYLHSLFPPLNYPEIKKIETLLNLKLPIEYKDFLFSYNGMNIFESNICVLGLSKKNVRNSFKDVFQPIDIIMENLLLKNKHFYKFAASSNGDSFYFNKNEANKVYLKKKVTNNFKLCNLSFYDWLEETVINFHDGFTKVKKM